MIDIKQTRLRFKLMNILYRNRDELLKANLDKLIAVVGIEQVSDYIINDETISEIEKTSLLFLVENKLAYLTNQ